MLRLARLCALIALLAALWAQPASAARILGLPETITTQHFQIHYEGGAPPPAPSIVHQDAGDLAGNLEQAYTLFVSQLGYPAPLSDGDGLIDVYVTDLSSFGALGAAFRDNPLANTSSGYIWIDDESVRSSETAVHELFHLIQYSTWAVMDSYVKEATAEWAAMRFLGFPLTFDGGGLEEVALAETLGPPDMSLTCSGSACSFSPWDTGGYSRWNFFQYLTERFGGQPVKEIFAKVSALNDTTLTGGDILTSYFLGRGTTIGNVFGDWTVANMTGSYTAPGLKGIQPVPYATTLTGSDSGALAPQTIAVNHLAARYIAFQRGSANSSGPCYAATLNVTVSLPSGLGARPYFYWTLPGSTAIPLAISGSTASVSVPWDTCTWSYRGLVSLPNPSAGVDAALFSVSGSIAVDKKTLVTSTPPPTGTYTGPTVPSPAGEEPPSIAVYGPETLRVSKRKRVVRVVVFSSGGGTLDAQLGSLSLGTRALRTGNNDLRFTLPRSVTRSLAAASRLTFTSFATNGTRGATVTRKLVLTK